MACHWPVGRPSLPVRAPFVYVGTSAIYQCHVIPCRLRADHAGYRVLRFWVPSVAACSRTPQQRVPLSPPKHFQLGRVFGGGHARTSKPVGVRKFRCMSCAAARSGCISCTRPYRGREHKTTACRYRRGARFPPCRLSGAWPIGAPRVAVHVPGATPQPCAPRIRRARVHPMAGGVHAGERRPCRVDRVPGYRVPLADWRIPVCRYCLPVYLSTTLCP